MQCPEKSGTELCIMYLRVILGFALPKIEMIAIIKFWKDIHKLKV